MLNEAQVAAAEEARRLLLTPAHTITAGGAWYPDLESLTRVVAKVVAERDELVRRLGTLETAAQVFFGSDSWCAKLEDHDDSATVCGCGYVQLRTAFDPAAPVADGGAG